MKKRLWTPGRRVSLAAQLGPLRRGSGDPTWGSGTDGAIWRTTLTPGGPGLERLRLNSDGDVEVQAWGAGADWLLERLPRLLGADDDPTGFEPPSELTDAYKRWSGWRVGRTDRVLEALIPAVLEQRVTGKEAWRAWRLMVRKYGEPAPAVAGAPPRLYVFPAPEVWTAIPSWEWHRAGVDPARSDTLMRVLKVADQLEASSGLTPEQAHSRLRQVSGVGIWTAAETAQRALGDPDAVSYRDFHIAKEVVYFFTGRMDGTDEEMAELLKPYAGHRYRVQRLIELSGKHRPRRGPRITIHDMRQF